MVLNVLTKSFLDRSDHVKLCSTIMSQFWVMFDNNSTLDFLLTFTFLSYSPENLWLPPRVNFLSYSSMVRCWVGSPLLSILAACYSVQSFFCPLVGFSKLSLSRKTEVALDEPTDACGCLVVISALKLKMVHFYAWFLFSCSPSFHSSSFAYHKFHNASVYFSSVISAYSSST